MPAVVAGFAEVAGLAVVVLLAVFVVLALVAVLAAVAVVAVAVELLVVAVVLVEVVPEVVLLEGLLDDVWVVAAVAAPLDESLLDDPMLQPVSADSTTQIIKRVSHVFARKIISGVIPQTGNAREYAGRICLTQHVSVSLHRGDNVTNRVSPLAVTESRNALKCRDSARSRQSAQRVEGGRLV